MSTLHEIAALILTPERREAAAELHAAWQATGRERPSTPADRRKYMRALEEWGRAEDWAKSNFAAALDWARSSKLFSPMQLADCRAVPRRADDNWWRGGEHRPSLLGWDHAEFYRIKRTPAAIIVHVYAANYSDCEAFAALYGLHFEPLPWSWYYPRGARAGVYLRRPSQSAR